MRAINTFTATALCAALFLLPGCGSSSSSDHDSASAAQSTPESPQVVASGVPNGDKTFDISVGDQIHVEEGMLDSDSSYDADGEAHTLIQARESGNKSGVERAYDEDIYRHYGGVSDQDAPPSCKVVAQDAMGVNTDVGYAYGMLTHPLHCTLSDGRNMYATSVQP